jgi:hypothetical protein
MNRFKRLIGYAAISLVAIGTTSSAWAGTCLLPNFGGGWKAYVSSVPSSSLGLVWANCRLVIRATDGVIGNTTCTTSLGVNGAFTNAKLSIVSSAACEFKAVFTVAGVVYTASSITLSDDHLSASGVGTYSGKAFTVEMVKIS